MENEHGTSAIGTLAQEVAFTMYPSPLNQGVRLALCALIALGVLSSTASAQWTQVKAVPAVNIYQAWTNGDTIAAGSDSTVFVSLDAGAT